MLASEFLKEKCSQNSIYELEYYNNLELKELDKNFIDKAKILQKIEGFFKKRLFNNWDKEDRTMHKKWLEDLKKEIKGE